MPQKFRPHEKLAVALRYAPNEERESPFVVAKGHGRFAERLLKLAEEHKIPIEKNKALVQVLATLELDQEIPPQLYAAVARILAFLHRVNGRV